MASPVGNTYSLVLNPDSNPSTGGLAICGFSTAGMVGSIAAYHVIRSLNIDEIGTVMHQDFPALALVEDSVPKHPVRVYQGDNLGVFIAEVPFPPEQDISFANTVLEWFTKGGFSKLIIVDGLVRQSSDEVEGPGLFAVASIEETRATLQKLGIESIKRGVVAGIAGYLLAEGHRRGLDVTALLAECNPTFPDPKAAATAIEAITEITGLELSLHELLEQAHQFDANLREALEARMTRLPAPEEDDYDTQDPMVG